MENKDINEMESDTMGDKVDTVATALRLLSRQRRKSQRELLRQIELEQNIMNSPLESGSNDIDYVGDDSYDCDKKASSSMFIGKRRHRQKTSSVSSNTSNYSGFFNGRAD